jgi:DNA-binding XRE family transcriptional regulator
VAKSLADHRSAVSGAHFSDDEMKNCVAELREARGWTKVDLADRPNISRQSIHAIESGKYDPSLPLAVLLASAPLAAADLSPRSWSPQERSELQHREQSPWPASARTLEGRSGYVAATLSPIATHVGIETLRQGGTAADAAVATALMQVTTSLGSIVSYAGVLQLVSAERVRQFFPGRIGQGRHSHHAATRRARARDQGYGCGRTHRHRNGPVAGRGSARSRGVRGDVLNSATPGR